MHGSIINAVAGTIADNIIRTAEPGDDITAIAAKVNDSEQGWNIQYRIPGGSYIGEDTFDVFQGPLSDADLDAAIAKAHELA